MNNGHSRLPPSKAYQWSRCTASVKFIADNDAVLPKDSSVYADEGTRAHAVLTAQLKHTLGQVPDNEEMRVIIDKLVTFIHSLIRPGDQLFVDQRVPLFYLKSERGTLDVSIIGPGRVVVLDLKYGAGVSVYAENNEQIAIYAESQIQMLAEPVDSATPVHLIIYQPRDRNDSNATREWVITRGELAEFCKKIQSKADTVLLDLHTEFMPGIACKFCRAEKTDLCKARNAYQLQGMAPITDAPVDFLTVMPEKKLLPFSITREQRQKILKWKSHLIEWLEGLEDQEVAELLHSDSATHGEFKLVEGKSNRQWTDPNGATKLLTEHFTMDTICPPVTPELVSPAQMEKLLKTVTVSDKFKADLYALIQKPTGKPTLVPVSDKRPALLLKPLEGLNKISEYDPRDLI